MRRCILLVLAVFINVDYIEASIAFVNQVDATSDSASTTIAAAAASHSTGNLVVVTIRNNSQTINVNSIADTAGNTYALCTGARIQAGDGTTETWSSANITGNASNVVTATFSASASFRRINVRQYSGAANSACEASGSANAFAASCTTSSFSPAASGNVNVAGSSTSVSETWTAGTNYTLVDSLSTDTAVEERLNAPSGSQTASISFTDAVSHSCSIEVASFKVAPAGAGGGSIKKKKPAIFF